MRGDVDAVGGFFEDLPVLAFVLAGVLSVSGTASWTAGQLSDLGDLDALDELASRLAADVIHTLQAMSDTPTAEGVRGANLSVLVWSMPRGVGCMVSVWCIHPSTQLLALASTGESGAGPSSASRAFANVLCEGGDVGVMEVRAVVWMVE